MSAKRGQCSVCRYRFRLRKDGTVQVHHLFCGNERNPEPCEGSGKPPQPLSWDDAGRPDCGDCLMYLYGPHASFLTESIYSVSIETGGDPRQMLRDYLSAYHERDHKDAVAMPDDAAGHLLRNIFGGPGHRDGPPFTHALKLPETEEEMAAEPPPSFTLEDGS